MLDHRSKIRAQAVREAVASSSLSGFDLDPAWRVLSHQFIRGAITTTDMLASIKFRKRLTGENQGELYEAQLIAVRMIEVSMPLAPSDGR